MRAMTCAGLRSQVLTCLGQGKHEACSAVSWDLLGRYGWISVQALQGGGRAEHPVGRGVSERAMTAFLQPCGVTPLAEVGV